MRLILMLLPVISMAIEKPAIFWDDGGYYNSFGPGDTMLTDSLDVTNTADVGGLSSSGFVTATNGITSSSYVSAPLLYGTLGNNNISQFTNDSGYLTSVDISDDTNLAVSGVLTLTDDTVGLSASQFITDTDIDTESELETILTDVTNIFTNNDTIDVSDNTNLAADSPLILTDDTLSITSSAFISDTDIDTEAELEAILTDVTNVFTDNDTIDISDNTNLAVSAPISLADDTLNFDCVDCLNADEIEDIYVLNTTDTMSGSLTIQDGLTVQNDTQLGASGADETTIYGQLILRSATSQADAVEFGTGANFANLYRTGNNELGTDDSFSVGVDLDVTGDATAGGFDTSGIVTATTRVSSNEYCDENGENCQDPSSIDADTLDGNDSTDFILSADLDTESELESQLTDVSNVFTNNDTIDISDNTNLAVSGVLTLNDDTVGLSASQFISDTDIDTEAELESILTDVTNVLTNNDTIDADTLDGVDSADFIEETELDTESKLESQLTDVSDVFTDNDTIDISDNTNLAVSGVLTLNDDTVGLSASQFISDTDIDTESELESILTDVSDVFTNNDTITSSNIDDVYLFNNANDTTTGTITAAGYTTSGIVTATTRVSSAEYCDENGDNCENISAIDADTLDGIDSNAFIEETELDTESELESQLTDVSNVFTDNDTITSANIDDVYLFNNADDTTSGVLTAGGFTTSGIVTATTRTSTAELCDENGENCNDPKDYLISGSIWTSSTNDVYIDSTSNNVGIGTNSPEGSLHVFKSEVNSPPSLFGAQNLLVLESNDSFVTAATILSQNTGISSWGYGDNDASLVFGMTYNHISDLFSLSNESSSTFSVTKSGDEVTLGAEGQQTEIYIENRASGDTTSQGSRFVFNSHGGYPGVSYDMGTYEDDFYIAKGSPTVPNIYIKSDNQIGINTNNPGTNFGVSGNISSTANIDAQGDITGFNMTAAGALSTDVINGITDSDSKVLLNFDSLDLNIDGTRGLSISGGTTNTVNVDPDGAVIDFKVGPSGSDTPPFFVDRSSSRVGIGTDSPLSMLHINNDTGTDANILVNNDATGLSDGSRLTIRVEPGAGDAYVRYNTDGDNSWYTGIDNSDEDKFKISWNTNTFASSDFVVDGRSGPRVGIDQSNPKTELHIGDSGTDTPTLRFGGSPLGNEDDPFSTIEFINNNSSNDGPQVGARIASLAGTNTGHGTKLAFEVSDGLTGSENASPTQAMVIDENGNVGINETNPGHKLEVAAGGFSENVFVVTESGGDDNFIIFSDSDGDALVQVKDKNGSAGVQLHSVANSYFTGGNVGIGDTNPTTSLHVSGTTYISNKLIMKSPDGTCSECGPDNSDNFVCTSVACP